MFWVNVYLHCKAAPKDTDLTVTYTFTNNQHVISQSFNHILEADLQVLFRNTVLLIKRKNLSA